MLEYVFIWVFNKSKNYLINVKKEEIIMVDIIIILVVIILLGIALNESIKHFKGKGPCCDASNIILASEKKILNSPIIGEITLKITGMHCQNCINKITKAINSIDGLSTKVDLDLQEAVILYDRPFDKKRLYQVIEKSGYHVE